MKKRLLAFCLTLCLLVGLFPTAVLAAGDTWTDEVTKKPEGYTVENSGDVTISSAEGLAWLGTAGKQRNSIFRKNNYAVREH